jgi:hypothetical protein
VAGEEVADLGELDLHQLPQNTWGTNVCSWAGTRT